MIRSVVVTLCCAFAASACVDDSSTVTAIYAPTLLTADPSTFLGNVRCGSELRQYVVTLFSVENGSSGSLGSAPPTDCSTPTTFGTPKIAAGGAYIAEIDGYDQVVVPEGGMDSSSRVMNDPTTMAHVAPRFTTSCGVATPLVDGAVPADANPLRYPTITLPNVEVTFRGCLPLHLAEVIDAGSPDSPADATTSDAGDDASVDASEGGQASGR
jgi:hypothetical protein